MSNAERGNPITRIVTATTKVKPNEIRATVLSFLFVFILMTAYFTIRPVRDAMASDWTRAETSWLWTMTFFCSVVGVSLYGLILSRVNFRQVVTGVYIFFAVSFIVFYFGSQTSSNPTLVDKTFYVWLSVFSLFHSGTAKTINRYRRGRNRQSRQQGRHTANVAVVFARLVGTTVGDVLYCR